MQDPYWWFLPQSAPKRMLIGANRLTKSTDNRDTRAPNAPTMNIHHTRPMEPRWVGELEKSYTTLLGWKLSTHNILN